MSRHTLTADHVAGLWQLVAGEDLERVTVEMMPSTRLRVDGFARADDDAPSIRCTVDAIGQIHPRSDVVQLQPCAHCGARTPRRWCSDSCRIAEDGPQPGEGPDDE